MTLYQRRLTTKITLAIGVLLLVVTILLGTGASLAWFADETPAIKNVFHFPGFDLKVEYKNDVVTDYTPLEMYDEIFNDEALYEPGYTQVVYLKIINNSEIDMKYKLSVDIRSVITAANAEGEEIYLPDHLRYGVIFGAEEAELDRELARGHAEREMAELELDTFTAWDDEVIPPEGVRYAAIVVYMPEEVGNEANTRDDHLPEVELGVTVYAQQTTE